MKMKTALIATSPKPRNPLVAAARFRHAGRHEQPGHTVRQQAAADLRREMTRLRPHSP